MDSPISQSELLGILQQKIFTIGWYNRFGKTTNADAEVNLEIQLNLSNDSFRIVHGSFEADSPDASNNTNSRLLNYFAGISNDLSCQTATSDISACEGKDYVQLIYFDPYGENDIDEWIQVRPFQNPNWGANNDASHSVDSMYNSNFSSPGNNINGSNYCYSGTGANGLSSSCSSTYTSSTAMLDTNGDYMSLPHLVLAAQKKCAFTLRYKTIISVWLKNRIHVDAFRQNPSTFLILHQKVMLLALKADLILVQVIIMVL